MQLDTDILLFGRAASVPREPCAITTGPHAGGGGKGSAMELDEFVQRCEDAWRAFVTGDAAPAKELFSHRDDVTLANPWGPAATGWSDVARTLDAAADRFRNGRLLAFEALTSFTAGDLAWYHQVERGEAMLSGRPETTGFALRVTTIYRREDVGWRILVRHADPIVAPRSRDATLDA